MSEQALMLRQVVAEKQREEALEREIIEGCREMAEVYLETQREFEPLDAEVSCAFSPR